MAFPGAGACLPACPAAGRTASGPGVGPDVLGSSATGAAGRGSRCPDPASDESRASVGDDCANIEPADHCATDDRNDPAGCASAGTRGSNSGVLSLTARYGKDLPAINGGLVWRVFADKPDDTGTFKLIREERGATPNIVLPPGSYVVHVALGLVSAVRAVSLKAETDRVAFVLPAGGLRIEGRVGSGKIPPNQISFALYKGSQFETAERASLIPNV